MSASLAFAPRRRWMAAVSATVVLLATFAAVAATSVVRVVVTSTSDRAARAAVERVGGVVDSNLPIVDGVAAHVPSDRIAELGSFTTVVADRALHVRSAAFDGEPSTAFPYEVGATQAWNSSAGEGVGVALVDTGVAPVPDLLDRVVAVADLTPELRFTDTFGHGTFMAGLIAGNGTASDGRYTGVAPGAHLVSIKVATADGSTTLSTVLEGLQLVERSRERFNIRVMLLALSSDSDLAPERDPLTRALRKLWDHGVFVVVPAGNNGPEAGSVDLPGSDPVLMTAGAVDDLGTPGVSDDEAPSWTGRGPTAFGDAKPDAAAPGSHLVSLRAPGSTIDQDNPSARVGELYFRGSGTSMAAAVTAGVAALVLAVRPDLSPDEMKQALVSGATPLDGADPSAIGAGVVNAVNAADEVVVDSHGHAIHRGGNGNNEGSNGWDSRIWNARVWDGRIWNGRIWNGETWDSRVWDGRVWDSRVWDGRVWDGRLWDSRVWDGRLWDSRVWNSRVWNSRVWDGRVWNSRVWSSRVWASRVWG
jgi:serine protease AprX